MDQKANLKIFVLLLLLFISGKSPGQLLNTYKYVVLPTKIYSDGSVDYWKISALSEKILSDFGLITISDTSTAYSVNITHPCDVLNFDSRHTVTTGPNEVKVVLKNCLNDTVYQSSKSVNSLMFINEDLKKATKQAWSGLNAYSYTYTPSDSVEKLFNSKLPQLEKIHITEDSIRNYLTRNPVDAIEGIYVSDSANDLSFYKFGIIRQGTQYKAVILSANFSNWQPGEVKAIFKPGTDPSHYSGTWNLSNKSEMNITADLSDVKKLLIDFQSATPQKSKHYLYHKTYPVK